MRPVLVVMLWVGTSLALLWLGDIVDMVVYLALGLVGSRHRGWCGADGWLGRLLLYGTVSALFVDMLNRVEGYPDGEVVRIMAMDAAFLFLGLAALVLMVLRRWRLGGTVLALLLLPIVQAPTVGARQAVAAAMIVPTDEQHTLQYVTRITTTQVFGVGARRDCATPAPCLDGLAYRRSGRTLHLGARVGMGRFSGSMDDQHPNLHPLLRPLLLTAPE